MATPGIIIVNSGRRAKGMRGTTRLAPTVPIASPDAVPNCGRMTPSRIPTGTVRVNTNQLIVTVNSSPFGVAVVATGTKKSVKGVSKDPIMFDVLSPSRPCRRLRGTRACDVHFCPAKRGRPSIVLRYRGLPTPAPVRKRPEACTNGVAGTFVGWVDRRELRELDFSQVVTVGRPYGL